jgi:hypothetical protein
MLLFCMGLGLISSKTMSEALSFRPLSDLGYAIVNNMLGSHGWSRVRVLAQNTSDDSMLEKIKRCVGQMEMMIFIEQDLILKEDKGDYNHV